VLVAAPGAADGWIAWPGYPGSDAAGEDVLLQVGNAGQALSSALAGLGKAMMPLPLVEEALADGRLVALGPPEEGRHAYWLVAPRPQWRQKKVKALVAFLTPE
jgi:LysR family glycine cleavage system transcriptional activator